MKEVELIEKIGNYFNGTEYPFGRYLPELDKYLALAKKNDILIIVFKRSGLVQEKLCQ